MIARTILRLAPRGGGAARAAAASLVVFVGLVVLVIGWIGVFFGRLIKAAVSRQREFLADASAVQFTRDPQGLAERAAEDRRRSAPARGSRTPTREEVAPHAVRRRASAALFATHPPLVERIREIDPQLPARGVRRRAPAHGRGARDGGGGGGARGATRGAARRAARGRDRARARRRLRALVANPGHRARARGAARAGIAARILPARGAPARPGDGAVRCARDRRGAGGARAATCVHPTSNTARIMSRR